MNKFPIIINPVKWPVNGRTNQYLILEQTMAFRIDTLEVRNPDPSILGIWKKKLFSMSKE